MGSVPLAKQRVAREGPAAGSPTNVRDYFRWQGRVKSGGVVEGVLSAWRARRRGPGVFLTGFRGADTVRAPLKGKISPIVRAWIFNGYERAPRSAAEPRRRVRRGRRARANGRGCGAP